jgi:hypothetical protein
MLGLNFVPCGDDSPEENKNTIEVCLETQTTDSHDHNDADVCSPFCICHCCQIHTIDFKLPNLNPLIPLTFQDIFIYFEGHVTAFNTSILQPPRV